MRVILGFISGQFQVLVLLMCRKFSLHIHTAYSYSVIHSSSWFWKSCSELKRMRSAPAQESLFGRL
jgi:hypothetical protein